MYYETNILSKFTGLAIMDDHCITDQSLLTRRRTVARRYFEGSLQEPSVKCKFSCQITTKTEKAEKHLPEIK